MEAVNNEARRSLEPHFLSRAQETGAKLRVGQMNKVDFEGTVGDIGRYDINLNVKGQIVTLLKQEITHLSAVAPLLSGPDVSAEQEPAAATGSARPNVQQEFLDKAIKEGHPLTIFLINGNRIKANIEAYDNFTILLAEGGRQHLYYKHAITTINR